MSEGNNDCCTKAQSVEQTEELRRRLEEAEQTLEAIRQGDVDALVVSGPKGEQVYSLAGAEHVYRVIVETMNEAALTVDADGTILFCNQRFCDLMKTPIQGAMSRKLTAFAAGPQQVPLKKLLADAHVGPVQRRLTLRATDGTAVPVQFSASPLQIGDSAGVCLVASDLTDLEVSVKSARILREHQQAVEESEERYRRIVEAANEGIWLIDAEDKTTFINKQGAGILGYTPSEMHGHSQVEYLYPADRIEGKNQLNARKHGKGAHLDYRMRHKNGSEVWVYSNTVPIYDGQRYSGALSMFSNVTERKQAEKSLQDANEELLARAEQLRTFNELLQAKQQEIEAANEGLRAQDRELVEQKERLRLALDAAHMGTWDWDLTTGHTVWNDEHYRLLGYRSDQVKPSYQAWAERVHPEDLPAAEAVLRRSMEQCTDYTAEYRVLWPDATVHWIEVRGRFESDGTGKAVRSYGVLTDITDRKRAEEELKQSRARLDWVLETTGVGTWLNELPFGGLNWDEHTRRLFFVPPGVEPTIELFWSRVHPDDREPTRLAVEKAIRDHTLYDIEHRAVNPDTGEVRWIRSAGHTTHAPDGTPIRFDGINYDITERKRAEEDLRLAYERLKTFFDHRIGGIGIVIANAGGDILQANDYYLGILGCTREELTSGRVDWRRMTPPEWLPADERALAQLRDRGVCDTYEKEYVRRDGTRVPALITDAMMPGDSGDILAFVLDITERKRAEEALAASRNQLQNIIDNTPAIVYAFDLEERFVMANTTVAELLDSTPEQMIGKRRHEFMPKEDADWHETNDRQVIEAGKALEFEEYSQLKGRSITWLTTKFPLRDAQGRMYAVAGISAEITERKQMEDALRELNATLESKVAERTATLEKERRRLFDVLEAVPAMVCLLTPDYHVAFANRSFREKFGESRGRRCYEYCFGRTEPCEFCETYRVLKTGRPHRWEVTGPDGRTIIDAYDFPFTDVDGSPLILEMDIDITDRKRAEAELKELNETLTHRARQLQKLTLELTQAEDRERQRIAALLHEDLQQHIAGAKFHLSLLGDRTRHDPAVQGIAVKVGEMLKEAIEKSRGLSHELSPAVLHHNDLTEAVNWLARRMQIKHGLRVRVEAPREVTLSSDALTIFLFRAAQEMLFNVVKHAGVREARIRVRRFGRWVGMLVSDRGLGFDPAELKEASGFGLLSLRERTELLGGRMKIRSAKGKGSRFHIVIPDAQPHAR